MDKGSMIIIEVYVDDIIFGSDDDRLNQQFSKDMQNEFQMSLLGKLNFFLDLQISQLNDGIFISQSKYIKEMLKKFGMEDFKPISTLMTIGCKLRKDDESKEVDQKLYRSMIGRLLYVTTSRLDVMQAIILVARFQANPKEANVLEIKRIFRYLKGTIEFRLSYLKGNEITLVTYIDAYQTGSIDDRKSTSGEKLYLGDCLLSWSSKKQPSVSLSTTKAQYIAATPCCTQVILMSQTLEDIQVKYDETIHIFGDNTSVINIYQNPMMHSKTKYIPIKFHFLREHVIEKNIRLEYVDTKEHIEDIFTKPLPRETFEYLRQKL